MKEIEIELEEVNGVYVPKNEKTKKQAVAQKAVPRQNLQNANRVKGKYQSPIKNAIDQLEEIGETALDDFDLLVQIFGGKRK